MAHYDYLIVGSGLYGATFAYRAKRMGKKCLVIDKRSHLGGNVYCEQIAGINVHKYGAHIFHTSNRMVWNFVNSIVEFNRYTNSPIANYKGELYNLPFNMNTFNSLWGVKTPAEAQVKIDEQRAEAVATLGGRDPQNLEEQALCLVGKDMFQKFIKEYTEKQWGRRCNELPAFDEYFGYCLGKLDWRTVNFKIRIENIPNYQGNAVVNYTSHNEPYTRVIEHKHFEMFGQEIYTCPNTVVSEEYSTEYKEGMEPYYPVNDDRNNALAEAYRQLADKEDCVIFGGRLGQYKYYDMAPVIEQVLALEIL